MNAAPNAIPVLLVTGFLGAGKTTLVNRILADPAFADTAVVVNEFGAVDIDGDLVRSASGDHLLATSVGCLCCTPSADIRATLFDLHETARVRLSRPFARVIVETTGLADPAAVINALTPGALPAAGLRDHTVARRFRLGPVITLVDAVTGDIALDRHLEAVKQVAFADEVLISKTDLLQDPASRRDLARLACRIAGLNPSARVSLSPDALSSDRLFALRPAPDRFNVDAAGWLAIDRIAAEAPIHPSAGTAGRHRDDIAAVVLRVRAAVPRAAIDSFLMLLRTAADAEVLRVKGLVAFDDDPDRPGVVHMVRHVVHPHGRLDAWPSANREGRLVVIGSGLDRAALQEVLDVLVSRPGRAHGRIAIALACTVAMAAGIGAAVAMHPAWSAGAGGSTSSSETKR